MTRDEQKFLPATDDARVKYHSSISQNNGAIAVLAKGEWCYLEFDDLLYVGCEGIKSERAVLVDNDYIGYNYDVKDQRFYTDTYIYHDNHSTELRVLPTWFGEGFYRHTNEEYDFINANNGSFGVRNEYGLRVGLSYALAEKTLIPAE